MATGNCRYTGTGADYFGPVFVHLFLITVLTCGLYGPWAWVRVRRATAAHTIIAGRQVSFVGTGTQLFYLILTHGLLTLATLGLYAPWAMCKIFTWQAHNTLVGNQSSRFEGRGSKLFRLWIVHGIILPLLTLGVHFIYGAYRITVWREEHMAYGGEHTSFNGRFGGFAVILLFGLILCPVTLNLFSPWLVSRLNRWKVKGLKVGDPRVVEHFSPHQTRPLAAVVVASFIILLLVALGTLFHSRVEHGWRHVAGLMPWLDRGGGGAGWVKKVRNPVQKPPSPGILTLREVPQQRKSRSQVLEKSEQLPADFDRELERINKLIEEDNSSGTAFYERAWLHASAENWQAALKDYTMAVELDPQLADAYYNRALIYIELEQPREALEDLNRVVALDPTNADAYCNRGNIHFELGNRDLAFANYTKAIRLRPGDRDLYYNRALLYLYMGKKNKAKADLKRAAELGHPKVKNYPGLSGPQVDRPDSPVGASGWTMDLNDMEIPDTLAGGRVNGARFIAESVVLENRILAFREGGKNPLEPAVLIFLFPDEGEDLEEKTYRITAKSSATGSPHIHMKWRSQKEGLPQTEIFMTGYVMHLAFGRFSDGILPGEIYLSLPDEKRSFLAGTFKAVSENHITD